MFYYVNILISKQPNDKENAMPHKPVTVELINGLERFGVVEMKKATDLMLAYVNIPHQAMLNNLPEAWEEDGVHVDFNTNSGSVFLTNTQHQALVLHEKYGLGMVYMLPDSSIEGILPVLCEEYVATGFNRYSMEDVDYLLQVIEQNYLVFCEREAVNIINKARSLLLETVADKNLPVVLASMKQDFEPGDLTQDFLGDVHDFNYNIYDDYSRQLFKGLSNAEDLVNDGELQDWMFKRVNAALFGETKPSLQ